MSAGLGAKAVARASGVSSDTLRHYERKGLLPGIRRTPAGYRRYPEATIERVLLIQRALVIGFSLDDLKRVLSVRDQGGAPCRGVRALVGQRLDALNKQIEDLSTLRDELRALLVEWDGMLAKMPSGKRAHLLDTLATKEVIEQARRHRHAVHNQYAVLETGRPKHPRV
jgi:DNA-binding transcriptional MerR regulator